jgi:hypothetical protein
MTDASAALARHGIGIAVDRTSQGRRRRNDLLRHSGKIYW